MTSLRIYQTVQNPTAPTNVSCETFSFNIKFPPVKGVVRLWLLSQSEHLSNVSCETSERLYTPVNALYIYHKAQNVSCETLAFSRVRYPPNGKSTY